MSQEEKIITITVDLIEWQALAFAQFLMMTIDLVRLAKMKHTQ